MAEKRYICIYGSSSDRIGEEYRKAAYRTGELIAQEGYGLVCGGGKGGLMAACIDGVLSRGGEAIGVLPEFMIAKNWQHGGLTELIVTPDMHSRKRRMSGMSTGVIAFAGGVGTMEELMEIITWRQLDLYDGKVVILNTMGFYDGLMELFAKMQSEGFMREGSGMLWDVANDADEAVKKVISKQ